MKSQEDHLSRLDSLLLKIGWSASAAYLLYLQLELVTPEYAFYGIYRVKLWLVSFVNLAIGIGLVFRQIQWRAFKFSMASICFLMLLVGLQLTFRTVMQNQTPLKWGFARSQAQLHAAVSEGEIGDSCGFYSITDIDRQKEFTAIYVFGNKGESDACGFVQVSQPEYEITSEALGQQLVSFLPLADGWYCFYSSYKWHKVGWS
ncbi:MAG: hypothetical protein AAF483_19095 [Planctomycetota bacterium]